MVTMTKFDATVVASAAVRRAKLRCMVALYTEDRMSLRILVGLKVYLMKSTIVMNVQRSVRVSFCLTSLRTRVTSNVLRSSSVYINT
jgi:hypothetical protein